MNLEAFREFVMPKLDYALRSTLVHRKLARKLDRFTRGVVRGALGLAGRTCESFFMFPLPREDWDCGV